MPHEAGASPDRVFLDANVLFSAAYREGAGLRRLWELGGVGLLTSSYALEEARRNLGSREQRARLNRLITDAHLVSEAPSRELPEDVELPDKDRSILQAALAAGATHLLTGDITDFGELLGREVGGLPVERPAIYLRRKFGEG